MVFSVSNAGEQLNIIRFLAATATVAIFVVTMFTLSLALSLRSDRLHSNSGSTLYIL